MGRLHGDLVQEQGRIHLATASFSHHALVLLELVVGFPCLQPTAGEYLGAGWVPRSKGLHAAKAANDGVLCML